MTRQPDIKSINCTSCGAGLDVLGGGRVEVHVCGYCGSELNAQDDYKVLQTFSEVARPDSPFRIGMEGLIEGVPFTIIGTLGMEESWRGSTWQWVDHQVFSPTHGYGYLTVESGHVTFTRRHRLGTSPSWISPSSVEISETRPVIRSGNTRYQYYETTASRVTFIEGEFNWRPRMNTLANTVSAISSDRMLSFRATGMEEEVHITQYLPAAETFAAFGIDTPPSAIGTHPLKPYAKGAHEGFLKWSATGFAVVALLMAVMFSILSFPNSDIHELKVRALPKEIPFEIVHPNRLAVVKISADVNNSWAFIGLTLTDPEDIPVFETGRTVERYSGRDADGSWSEGRNASTLRFIPRQAGTYTLEVDVEESDTWNRIGFAVRNVTVTTRQGVISGFWMLMVALGFGLFALYHHSRSVLHHYWRMRGSDWSDD